MRITKHEHSCLVVEVAGSQLVIDPGSFTPPLIDTSNVAAIVLTHQHPDHWTPEHLQRILERNSGARLFAPPGTVAAAGDDFTFTETHAGDSVTVGAFSLKFFGSQHAVIHSSIPVVDNVGVMVNDELFYPGDAFTVPPLPVPTLAVPCGAPWMKIAEVMDYVAEIQPRRAFPVHEMGYSVSGKNLAYDRIKSVVEQHGGAFFAPDPTQWIDV
jgi:L-ascorbate metabolism protein UlaG (beta-lactamase superfamily)